MSTSISTAISIARFQCWTAAWRSSSSFEAQRYIGRSEAIPTPLSFSAFLKDFDPLGEDARRLEPFEEIAARRELDPVVAELGFTLKGSSSSERWRCMNGSRAIFIGGLLRFRTQSRALQPKRMPAAACEAGRGRPGRRVASVLVLEPHRRAARMAIVACHVAFDLGFELGHRLAAGHQVGDLLAALLALAEVGGLGALMRTAKWSPTVSA